MDLENLFLCGGKEYVDLGSFLHELEPSPIELSTHEISFPSKTDCPVLAYTPHMDLSQHAFPVIDARIIGAQKGSSVEYPDAVLESTELHHLANIFRVNNVDIPSETHGSIRPDPAFYNGSEYILQREWGETLPDTGIARRRRGTANTGMLVLLAIPLGPLPPLMIDVVHRFELVFLQEILLDEPIIALFLALRLRVPLAGEYQIDAEAPEHFFELRLSRTKIPFELRSLVRNHMLREAVRLEGLLDGREYTAGGLVQEPPTASKVSTVVIDKRMKVYEANSPNDDSVHDVDLPGIIRLGIFEVLIRFERFEFSSILPVFQENAPDGLAVKPHALFPKEIPYLPAASAPAFPLQLQYLIFDVQCDGVRFAAWLISQTLNARLVISVEEIFNRRPGALVAFAGCINTDFASLDWQHDSEPCQDILIFVHWFHLDHRRGQGPMRLSSLALGRFRVTNLGRFSCYITNYHWKLKIAATDYFEL